MSELGFAWEEISHGGGSVRAPTQASSGHHALYAAPIVNSPPLNAANEILWMLGSHENGGSFEASPNRLNKFLGTGEGNTGTFHLELGKVSGRVSTGTLAIGALAVVVVLGWILWRGR